MKTPTHDKITPHRNVPSGPFLVIAVNGVAAKQWARERGLKCSEWKYLTHVNQPVDATGRHIVSVNGWKERPDAPAIEAWLEKVKAENGHARTEA